MEAPELERRLAAILAADVEGYSRLMQAMKKQQWRHYLPVGPLSTS